MRRGQLKRLGHESHDVRLGDRLSKPDWEGTILVGSVRLVRRDEAVPGHGAHRGQDPGILYPTRRDLILDHLDARLPLRIVAIGRARLAGRPGLHIYWQ
jgi:hypothetical protein